LAGISAAIYVLTAVAASADDRHAGYYYPDPATTETYKARARTLAGADRA
jgi:hypothetical protein